MPLDLIDNFWLVARMDLGGFFSSLVFLLFQLHSSSFGVFADKEADQLCEEQKRQRKVLIWWPGLLFKKILQWTIL